MSPLWLWTWQVGQRPDMSGPFPAGAEDADGLFEIGLRLFEPAPA